MIDYKKILTIIVARKGSKRLKNKNILSLNGRPLIDWTFKSALDANLDKIIVSTDDDEVIKIANQYKLVEVPFVRPKYLSDDKAKSIDVIIHAVEFFEKKNQYFDYVLLLQPTSPLRKKEDINRAILELKRNDKAKAVVSVSEVEHSPLWSNTLPDDLSMKNFLSQNIKNLRSQDLPKYFRINGAIYIAEINYLKKEQGFIGSHTFAYKMPQSRSIDIDTKLDLEICKVIMNENSKNNS